MTDEEKRQIAVLRASPEWAGVRAYICNKEREIIALIKHNPSNPVNSYFLAFLDEIKEDLI